MDTVAVTITSSAPMSAQIGIQNIAVEPELIQVLTVEQFIEKCLRFNEAHPGLVPNIQKGTDCPVHIYAEVVRKKSCKTAVSGIRYCKLCGKATCPVCHSHSVEQVSRVTGYVASISGYNEAKKQEVRDRQRYSIGMGGSARNVNR